MHRKGALLLAFAPVLGCDFSDVDGPIVGAAPAPAPAGCLRNIDCPAGEICDDGACRPVYCLDDVDCAANETCHVEAGICLPPAGCLEEPACTAPTECVVFDSTGVCALPDATMPDSCLFSPSWIVMPAGASARLEVRGLSFGQLVPYASFALEIAGDAGTLAGDRVTLACPSDQPCISEVRATSASNPLATCTASVIALPPVAASSVRVLLLEEGSGRPLAGERVVLTTASSAREEVTGEHGTATFAGVLVDAVASLSAFPALHDWHTVVGLAASDVVLVTRPALLGDEVAGATGGIDMSLVHTAGDVKGGFVAAALERGLSGTFSLATMLGPLVTHTLRVEGLTPAEGTPMDVPLGVVATLGTSTIQDRYVALGRPGQRLLVAAGGAHLLSRLGVQISSLTSGGGDPRETYPRFWLSLGQKLDYTLGPVLPFAPTAAPEGGIEADRWSWQLPQVEHYPSTFPRRVALVRAPLLPCLDDDGQGGCARHATAALAFASVVTPFGWAPLGMVHAEDDPDDDDDAFADGIVDASHPELPGGVLRLLWAPPMRGAEGEPVALTLAAVELAEAFDESPTLSLRTLALDERAGAVDAPPFLPFAKGRFVQRAAGGVIALDEPAAGADVHRFHLAGFDGGEWHVWLLAGAAEPDLDLDLDELRPADVSGRDDFATLQAIELGAVLADEPLADGAALFSPARAAQLDLRRYAVGFSSAPCLLAGGPQSPCVTLDAE